MKQMGRLILRRLEADQILDINNVSIEFHPRLTVLMGDNSAGKTMLCGASVLALLGLKELGSTHWAGKITRDNIARKGVQGGKTTLTLKYGDAEYTFTYHHRDKHPHEVTGPEGKLNPQEALRQLGVDFRAVSFLTTSERRPPWMTVEGDDKTGDVKTVLRNSLQTSLATREEGCKRVCQVIENEKNVVEEHIRNIKTDFLEIVNRWVEKGAFAGEEREEITTVNVVEGRLNTLSTLKESLDRIRELLRKLGELTQLSSDLERVADLPTLIERGHALEGLAEDLKERTQALRNLVRDRLGGPMPSVEGVGGNKLAACLKRVNQASEQLLRCLDKLKELDVVPSSLEQLSQMQRQYADELEKLKRTKEVLTGERESLQVQCTVYRGKPLLVQLDEDFARSVSFEELRDAQVIVPYSPEEEKRISNIVEWLDRAKQASDELAKALQDTQRLVQQMITDIRVKIAGMQAKLDEILRRLPGVGCPEDKLPEPKTGKNLDATIRWVKECIAEVRRELDSSTHQVTEILKQSAMRMWRSKIEPILQRLLEPGAREEMLIALDECIEALKEAIRSLNEHKERFATLVGELVEKEQLRDCYEKGIEVLETYLDEVRFKEETVERLVQTFLDFVRNGKERFGFRFGFDLDEKGNPVLRHPDIEGVIQTGGGETQVLGILEMLAVAAEFGLPVFIDEVRSYLSLENLRKALEFIYDETEVQVILTTTDEELPQRLTEWGIEHRAYTVTKNAQGYTQVRTFST